jgi:hypothetical protein
MDRQQTPSRSDHPFERVVVSCVPDGAPSWVTDELIKLTLDTFESHYEKTLTPEDALEIVTNMANLMDLL